MLYPTLREEKRLWKKGFKRVVCLDEAGRGPLAGPVVAVAATLKKFTSPKFASSHIKDSKKLSRRKREEFLDIFSKTPEIKWGIGRVSERVIDRINILEATKLAMERAIKKLGIKPDFLILDGRMKLDLKVLQKSIIKADEKVFSCAVASIISKVFRDRIMRKCHSKYPQYCFDKHKGYPTKIHRQLLKKYGPCRIHRKSFRLVKRKSLLTKKI
jgi:ribonuclease HII